MSNARKFIVKARARERQIDCLINGSGHANGFASMRVRKTKAVKAQGRANLAWLGAALALVID